MKPFFAVVACAFLAAGALLAQPQPQMSRAELAAMLDCSGKGILTVPQLCQDAISEDKAKAESAIRMLRARGPEGLTALLEAHAGALKIRVSNKATPLPQSADAAWLRLRAALDGVAQQRDCYASQLYWYTDFEQAKVAAKASAKPILSLRLLGKLDEEFSCANSRFFRTTLYSNHEIAKYLADHYVLHWKSVRPVPKVTIDFGDGRKLEQTLTGNSIHYILNADGGVVDALPGLYGPQTFLQELQRVEKVIQESATLNGETRERYVREFHQSRLVALNIEFANDLKLASGPTSIPSIPAETVGSSLVRNPIDPPTARAASGRAFTKGGVESPLLRSGAATTPDIDDATWQKIAARHADSARLDAGARALISAKAPSAFVASRLAIGKSFSEAPLLRQIRNLERSISEDTARNEYLFHTRIHEWLASGSIPAQVDALNAKVYADLFLTPESDPWLGLLPDNSYAALENDGIVLTTKK